MYILRTVNNKTEGMGDLNLVLRMLNLTLKLETVPATFNPFSPFLNLDMSTDANRGLGLKSKTDGQTV